MALIVLDRQHSGKPRKPWDRGAGFDLDGDGQVEVVEQEAILTPVYGLQAGIRLIEAGHHVIPISDGSYSERHARARAMEADIYVALHINMGGANRGVGFYDRRSGAGKVLAGFVAAQLGAHCPELGSYRRLACYDDRAEPQPWLFNPWATIRGVYQGRPVGLCYEPFQLNHPSHRALASPEGLARVGAALAAGIIDYLES